MRPSETRCVAELIGAMESGGSPEFLFFWGHTPGTAGVVDRSCFSNWFPSPFEIDGVTYPTVEHHMMSEKARLFGDEETRARILQAPTPGEAKRLGREVAGFDESIWLRERFEIVVAGNLVKFRGNVELGKYLACTAGRVLVEASPVDRIWGIGLAKDADGAEDPQRWRGLNLLGFALMEVRSRLDLPS